MHIKKKYVIFTVCKMTQMSNLIKYYENYKRENYENYKREN